MHFQKYVYLPLTVLAMLIVYHGALEVIPYFRFLRGFHRAGEPIAAFCAAGVFFILIWRDLKRRARNRGGPLTH